MAAVTSSESASSSAAVLDALRFARCSNAPRYYAPTLLSHLGASLERRVTTYENWWPTTRKVPKRYAAQEARDAFVDVQKKTSRDALLDGGAAAAAAFSRACGRFRSGRMRASPSPRPPRAASSLTTWEGVPHRFHFPSSQGVYLAGAGGRFLRRKQ